MIFKFQKHFKISAAICYAMISDVELKMQNKSEWYSKSAKYWEKEPATVDGVLGGYGILHNPDMIDSHKFLDKLDQNLGNNRAIDCGAGIGRIAKDLLCARYKIVDVLEQDPKYVEQSKIILQNMNIGEFICKGLQEFNPTHKYNLIWIQWVSNYLTDDDFVDFLVKCKNSLENGGIIVVKENMSQDGIIFDSDDTSVTRSDKLYKEIFKHAGLQIQMEVMQTNFPKELFKVKMYALRP